jgi:hypothetical protein
VAGAAAFLFAGTWWSGGQAHALELSPAETARQDAEAQEAKRLALLGRLQLAGVAARAAGSSLPPVTDDVARPSPGAQALALARYVKAVGAGSIQAAVAESSAELAQQVLSDPRIVLDAAGRADVAAGRIDPRVLALLGYLAEAHGQVTVSCLVTGHSRFVAQTAEEKKRKAPRRVSAHVYGRAVDISAMGGVPVVGHQQPGGIVERAVEEILSLPPALQPAQVISLLDLSGPSFRLPDHADHLHIGY